MDTQRQYSSSGPHPFVWVAVPLGLALAGLAVIGFTAATIGSVIVGVLCAALAVAVLISSAYSAWGRQEVEYVGTTWVVTRRLGAWSRSTTFDDARIRSVENYSPPPFVVIWPGVAGRHVRVHMKDTADPIAIGAGLSLGDEDLRALYEMLCARSKTESSASLDWSDT